MFDAKLLTNRYMIALGEYKAHDEQQYYDEKAGLMEVNWPGWNEVASSFSITTSEAIDLSTKVIGSLFLFAWISSLMFGYLNPREAVSMQLRSSKMQG